MPKLCQKAEKNVVDGITVIIGALETVANDSEKKELNKKLKEELRVSKPTALQKSARISSCVLVT